MTADATLSISLVVLIVGIALNIYGFFNTRKKDIKGEANEIYEIRESLVKIDMKTGNLNTTMNDIRTDVRSISGRIGQIEKDLERLKQRVDNIEKTDGRIGHE